MDCNEQVPLYFLNYTITIQVLQVEFNTNDILTTYSMREHIPSKQGQKVTTTLDTNILENQSP